MAERVSKSSGRISAKRAFIDYVDNAENHATLNKAAGEVSAVSAANHPDNLDPWLLQIVNEQLTPATQPYTFLEHVSTIATREDALGLRRCPDGTADCASLDEVGPEA